MIIINNVVIYILKFRNNWPKILTRQMFYAIKNYIVFHGVFKYFNNNIIYCFYLYQVGTEIKMNIDINFNITKIHV